jgi:hypothetical protein
MSFDAERPQREDSLAETFDARPYASAPFPSSCFSRTPVEPTKIIPAFSNVALIAESVDASCIPVLAGAFSFRRIKVELRHEGVQKGTPWNVFWLADLSIHRGRWKGVPNANAFQAKRF